MGTGATGLSQKAGQERERATSLAGVQIRQGLHDSHPHDCTVLQKGGHLWWSSSLGREDLRKAVSYNCPTPYQPSRETRWQADATPIAKLFRCDRQGWEMTTVEGQGRTQPAGVSP